MSPPVQRPPILPMQRNLASFGDRETGRYTPAMRGGFTLLEVLLAVALTALVLGIVVMAIDFHLRVAVLGRTEVEQAQLARAVLQRIATDIRNTITANSSSGTASPTSASTSSDSTDEQTEETSVDSSESPSVSSLDAPGPRSMPGLYGSNTWLQLDVSHLPRPDQLHQWITTESDSSLVDRLSDVRTVFYSLAHESEFDTATLPEEAVGLLRYEQDRATALQATEQARLTETGVSSEPFAPEVAAIRFRYLRGAEMADRWDTEEAGGLPTAVEIVLQLGPVSQDASPAEPGTVEPDAEVYRLVVRLPTAEAASPAGSASQPEETTVADESGSTTEGGRE